jgi:hypothetical protein
MFFIANSGAKLPIFRGKSKKFREILMVIDRLTTFFRNQNRTKKYKGPPFDIYKKNFTQI